MSGPLPRALAYVVSADLTGRRAAGPHGALLQGAALFYCTEFVMCELYTHK